MRRGPIIAPWTLDVMCAENHRPELFGTVAGPGWGRGAGARFPSMVRCQQCSMRWIFPDPGELLHVEPCARDSDDDVPF